MAQFIIPCITFIFVLVATAPAQINVNSSGRVGVGTSPHSNYTLYAYNLGGYNNGGIRGKAEGGYANYGVRGVGSGGYATYGVYGNASGGIQNWAGYFNGSVYATGSYQSSDRRFKKNIQPLKAAGILDKVMQLTPRRYEFLSNEELTSQYLPALNAKGGTHMGLLAQEVEQLFPEMVTEVVHMLEKDGRPAKSKPDTMTSKAINYQELTVILLSALQEQQKEIEALKKKVNNK